MRLIFVSWLREILRRPALTLLSIVGVALGVATVAAVDIANDSAKKSFLAANETIYGTTTHRITGRIAQELYRHLRVDLGLDVTPVADGLIESGQTGKPRLRLYGIDPLAEINVSSNQIWSEVGIGTAATLIGNQFTVMATPQTAQLLGWSVGETITISGAEDDFNLTLIGLLEPANPLQAQSLRYLLLTDIATAQIVLDRRGYLSAIHALFDESAEIELTQSALPDDVYIENQSQQNDSQVALTRAFQINLTALGLLAFLVAMFLIYNTTSFMINRRQRHIGLIRILGALPRDIIVCALLEVVIISAIATAIGLAIGIQLSVVLLELVEQSIATLYFPISADIAVLSPITVTKAIILGIVTPVLLALAVIRTISSMPPAVAVGRSRVEHYSTGPGIRSFAVGCGGMVAGALLLWGNQRSIVLGFAGIFLIVIGYLQLVPLITDRLKRLLRPLIRRGLGVQGLMTIRAFSSRPGQTSITIAVLCLALSAVIGVDIMVSSFRLTVDQWLTSRLRGDVYITTPSQSDTGLKLEDIAQLQELDGLTAFGVAKWATIPTVSGKTTVFAVDYGEDAFRGFQFKEQTDNDVWTQFTAGAVIVSEPYAYRNDVRVGDTVELLIGKSPVRFPIAGVFYDYSSDQGIVAIHRDVYVSHFGDHTISSVALFADPQTDLAALSDTIEQRIQSPQARVWRNQELHEASMQIFDQTFAITYVLRTLAIIVAFVAVLSALATLQIERERELVVLRTIGFTVLRNWSVASIETGVMGLLAGMLSLPIGILMAWLLIWVIEQRSFGWTMKMQLDPLILIEAVALAVIAALIAGTIAAWRQVRKVPAMALQGID
ncbi:MAG: ABC transporter permease [Acidiferrobacterales bacterium]|nr:ABC transporter permease [Acidiferrobacterales bacterium]